METVTFIGGRNGGETFVIPESWGNTDTLVTYEEKGGSRAGGGKKEFYYRIKGTSNFTIKQCPA